MEVLPIEESCNSIRNYQRSYEIDYTPRYCLNVVETQSNYRVLFHVNNICVITLALSHPILVHKKTIVKIDFQISPNINRFENKVSGKAKRGAQLLKQNSKLFFVECSDGSNYTIYSCINGKLIEINKKLSANPNLIVEYPSDQGYIAIVLPKNWRSKQYRQELMTSEQYEEIMKQKQQIV